LQCKKILLWFEYKNSMGVILKHIEHLYHKKNKALSVNMCNENLEVKLKTKEKLLNFQQKVKISSKILSD
jgi:hypothetical protein